MDKYGLGLNLFGFSGRGIMFENLVMDVRVIGNKPREKVREEAKDLAFKLGLTLCVKNGNETFFVNPYGDVTPSD